MRVYEKTEEGKKNPATKGGERRFMLEFFVVNNIFLFNNQSLPIRGIEKL